MYVGVHAYVVISPVLTPVSELLIGCRGVSRILHAYRVDAGVGGTHGGRASSTDRDISKRRGGALNTWLLEIFIVAYLYYLQ